MVKIKICTQKGTLNRFGGIKPFTCLEVPPAYMHKPIKDWMCVDCALNLVDLRIDQGKNS